PPGCVLRSAPASSRPPHDAAAELSPVQSACRNLLLRAWRLPGGGRHFEESDKSPAIARRASASRVAAARNITSVPSPGASGSRKEALAPTTLPHSSQHSG